jgi:hypothetical protein
MLSQKNDVTVSMPAAGRRATCPKNNEFSSFVFDENVTPDHNKITGMGRDCQ